MTERPPLFSCRVRFRAGSEFFDRFAGWGGRPGQPSSVLRVLFAAGGDLAHPGRPSVVVVTRCRSTPFLDATYQLEINTTTTIITFLMVALLQNSQTRDNQAVPAQAERYRRRRRRSDGARLAEQVPDSSLQDDMLELRSAIGLETREGTSGNAKSRPARHRRTVGLLVQLSLKRVLSLLHGAGAPPMREDPDRTRLRHRLR